MPKWIMVPVSGLAVLLTAAGGHCPKAATALTTIWIDRQCGDASAGDIRGGHIAGHIAQVRLRIKRITRPDVAFHAGARSLRQILRVNEAALIAVEIGAVMSVQPLLRGAMA